MIIATPFVLGHYLLNAHELTYYMSKVKQSLGLATVILTHFPALFCLLRVRTRIRF